MPKTSWKEPERDNDHLLKLPKGRFLTPTDEVHELAPVEDTTRARPVLRAASFGKTPPSLAVDMYRSQYITPPKEKDGGYASSEPGIKAAMSGLEGIRDEVEGYNGDAEHGPASAVERPETPSIAFNGEEIFVPGTEDDPSNDGILAGEENDTEDEHMSTHAQPSLQSTLSASPRPVQASKHRSKALRRGTESIRPHPTDPSKVIVTYHVAVDGKPYQQETEIPEAIPTPADVPGSGGSVIYPKVETATVPRTPKSLSWTPVRGSSGYEWTRGEGDKKESWRINVFFRRLDRNTHAFQDIYVNTSHLKNVNPNDSKFRNVYNKWVLQFARRQDVDYTQKVARVHWNVAERCALYTATNAFCAKFGVHNFGFAADCKLSTEQLQIMADAVNAAPNPLRLDPRGIDAVRGQISSAHNKSQPKNKAIFDLLAKGSDFRERMSGGEVIPEIERKPKTAIPLSKFPMNAPRAATPLSTPDSKKRKRTAVVQERELSSSELSSSAGSELGGDRSVSEDITPSRRARRV